MMHNTILITGAAGFIGSNLVKYLFSVLVDVVIIGIDNMNDYYDTSLKNYDVSLKEYRINELNSIVPNGIKWKFIKADISNGKSLNSIFNEYKPQIVVNLAAQPGVRYSVENPAAYLESNVVGFFNVIEMCRNYGAKHLIYASSSSVYGEDTVVPFNEDTTSNMPVSFYATTKKTNELFAHCYSKMYGITMTGLRFFTVYGACGRPDMAYFDFTNKILNREHIPLFNYGNNARDFTYIDDVIHCIYLIMKDTKIDKQPSHKIYNIGSGKPIRMMDFIDILCDELKSSKMIPNDYDINTYIKLMPKQPVDVSMTCADMKMFNEDFGFTPTTNIHDGIKKFIKWYTQYTKTHEA